MKIAHSLISPLRKVAWQVILVLQAPIVFIPLKNLELGDAGAIVTSDADIDNKARSLRNYGQSERFIQKIGLNSRLDEVQAVILIERCVIG